MVLILRLSYFSISHAEKNSIEHIYSIYTSKIEEFVLGGLEGNALDVEPLYPGSNPTFGIF